jgi:hypothetical protein
MDRHLRPRDGNAAEHARASNRRHVTIAPTVLTPPSGPVIGVGVTLNL